MSSMVTAEDLRAVDLSQLCRGCLTASGEMRNMVEWGLVDDFYKLTNIQVPGINYPFANCLPTISPPTSHYEVRRAQVAAV